MIRASFDRTFTFVFAADTLEAPSNMFLYGGSTTLWSTNIIPIPAFLWAFNWFGTNIWKAFYNPCVVLGDKVERLIGRYFPTLVAARNPGKTDMPRKRYQVCYARGKRLEKDIPLKWFMCASFTLHYSDCTQLNVFRYTIPV